MSDESDEGQDLSCFTLLTRQDKDQMLSTGHLIKRGWRHFGDYTPASVQSYQWISQVLSKRGLGSQDCPPVWFWLASQYKTLFEDSPHPLREGRWGRSMSGDCFIDAMWFTVPFSQCVITRLAEWEDLMILGNGGSLCHVRSRLSVIRTRRRAIVSCYAQFLEEIKRGTILQGCISHLALSGGTFSSLRGQ